MSFNITISPPEINYSRTIKFPEPAINSRQKHVQNQKNIVTISPSEDPSTPEFAFELLEAELELESGQKIQKKLVTKLFELYRLGIEHYNQKKSKKETYFQKKLQALTNNPIVLGALHQSDKGAETFYKKKQIEKLVEIDEKKTLPAHEMLKSIFSNELKVQSQLKNQSDLIQKRLFERKMMKKSFQGERDNDIDDIPVPARKKLNKTVIIASSNPQEDQSKYFVDGATFS